MMKHASRPRPPTTRMRRAAWGGLMWTAREQCRAHRLALPQPQPAPAAERLKDVAHASGFGAWISVPLVVMAMTAVAIISGGLTALGRVAALGAETIFLGLGVLGRLRTVPGRLRAVLVRAFVLHPDALTSTHHAFPDAPPPSAPALPGMPTDQALVLIEQAMAEIPAKGDATLPDDVATLALLLSPAPPATDFKTADLVRNCFAAPAMDASTSRALLAVALRLARGFGTPDHLPLATIRAWRMLDPEMFEAEMAAQLAAISRFIAQWQETQQTFLCLEFAEVELIEFLFESLPPARHGDGLCDILNFKVLSNRRQGILRRIPHRLRKSVQNCGSRSAEAIAAVEATRTLLDRIAASHGYPPIVEAANAALDEVKKIAATLQPPPPAVPAEAGPPLARIAPVKRPATAAEIAAMTAAATISLTLESNLGIPAVRALHHLDPALALAPLNQDDPHAFAWLMLTTTVLTTAIWLAVTLATQPESEPTLQAFYDRVRPAALGWRRFAAAREQGDPTLRYNLFHWILGFTLVYAMLFGVGDLLFARIVPGCALLTLSAACLAVLFYSLNRRGWSVWR